MLRTAGLVIIFAASALAETQSGVVTSGGQPIPGATVAATCGTGADAAKISTVTDAAGRFEMGGLPATPCRFTVGIFGFDAAPREVSASDTPLTFDLRLQARATLPPDPNAPAATQQAAGGRGGGRGFGRRGQSPDGAPPTESTMPGPGRGGFNGQARAGGPGRGGFGRQGANGAANTPAGQQGFQSLSLQQNGEGVTDTDAAGLGGADTSGANEAFLVNGTVSQGVVAQPGDAFGIGPGGFPPGANFSAGGPAGNPFGANAGDPALTADAGGPGGGAPGGGGFGGGGGGGGRGGGGFGGGRGGGRGNQPNRNVQFGNRVNRGRRQQFQGNAYYTIGNSVLNARPYSFTSPTSLTGGEVPKAAYANNRFG